MNKFRHGVWIPAALAVVGVLSAGPMRGQEALDYAFRFATAIETDAKDRSKAQAIVVDDFASIGALSDALSFAEQVDGWRRGTALADIAALLARRGEIDRARQALAQAGEIAEATEGWEKHRIQAHIATALAALGDIDRSEAISRELAENDARQYGARATATLAAAHAAVGGYDEGIGRLKVLDEAVDVDDTWWRTAGYLSVAKLDTLTQKQRLEALDLARKSAEQVPGWKQAEALSSIAEQYRLLEQPTAARKALKRAESVLLPIDEALPIRSPLLSNLGRAWAEFGDRKHAEEIVLLAEKAVGSSMPIERPGILANIATSWEAIGDRARAEQTIDQALTVTEGLVNARPRALAVVSICRTLGRHGVGLDSRSRERLDALYTGLGEPW